MDIHDNPIDDADGARRDALIGSARSLLPDIRSMVDEIDEARRLPDRLVDKLADAGFFRMLLDRELGGLEADPSRCGPGCGHTVHCQPLRGLGGNDRRVHELLDRPCAVRTRLSWKSSRRACR